MKIYKISMFLLLIIFAGCSDKSDKDTKHKANTNISNNSTPKIEVVANPNQKEIKVEEKHSSTKNKSYYLNYGTKSEYDENSQPANKDASVRVKPRTAIDANMHIRSPYENVQISLIVQQLSLNFRVKCSACHDDYANGVIGPSLLQKDSDFIYNAINDFKTGKKSNPLMTDLINMMSDKEIREISNEIFEFNKRIKKLKAKK